LDDLFPGAGTTIIHDRHEVEDDCASRVTLSIGRLFVRKSGAVERAAKLQSTGLYLKQQQFSAGHSVVAYGRVTTLPFHFTDLSFAKVPK